MKIQVLKEHAGGKNSIFIDDLLCCEHFDGVPTAAQAEVLAIMRRFDLLVAQTKDKDVVAALEAQRAAEIAEVSS